MQLEPGSRLAQLAGAAEVVVNSSHHQSVLEPGRNLRVAARARDGVVEAVEWTGGAHWIIGRAMASGTHGENRFPGASALS